MKNFKKVIVSILAVVMLVSIVVCFSGCGDESKENTQVETTEVVTTAVSTTATPTTIAPTTIKPTEQPTTTKTTEISNDEAQEDNEDEDGSWSYNDSNNSSSNGDMDSSDYLDSNMSSDAIYSPDEFQTTGVVGWGGYEWTYYSELILPGEGLDIPGRYTTEDGYVCDGDGYVVLAANLDILPRYSVVETPFGYTGKIYDTGCAYGTLDVYVGW